MSEEVKAPERIWLIPDGEGGFMWCDSPDPGADMDPADATEYVLLQSLTATEARAEAAEERVRELTIAAQDVLAERARQKSVEGWCSSHDDDYEEGQLARAAASYAISAATPGGVPALSGSMFGCQLFKSARNPNFLWPWEMRFWKPKDPRRDLVRAAALILAEIERLDRAARALKGNTP